MPFPKDLERTRFEGCRVEESRKLRVSGPRDRGKVIVKGLMESGFEVTATGWSPEEFWVMAERKL